MAADGSRNDFGITLDDAISELTTRIESARNFIFEEFEDDWDRVERYFNGEVEIPDVAGRSTAVKTEVRDMIRSVLPSILRVLLQSRKIVEYRPKNVLNGDWTEQQALYVTQLFWACGGYTIVNDAIHDALKRRYGVLAAHWVENPLPTYFKYTQVNVDLANQLAEAPDVEITNITPVTGEELNEKLGVEEYSAQYVAYDVEGYKFEQNGKIVLESVPPEEFFMSRNCRSVEDAIYNGVHGRSRVVTVEEAIELGLEHDDWLGLDAEDPDNAKHVGSGTERRGYYSQQEDDMSSVDLLKHEFLLTQVYVRYDLQNTGRAQLYCFHLGGTAYQYLAHEEVEDSPYEVGRTHLVEHEWVGDALGLELCKDQDINSSILRAVIDNFHHSNAPRLAADPVRTDFRDLMSLVTSAPIKTKGDPAIQVVSVPFTGQAGMGILAYLDKEVQERAGVTKAAQGLDPDAMQSTDKEAVRNTIQLSQGQIELMTRNFIETGLIPIFRKLLKLSIRHLDPIQMVRTKGVYLPVPQSVFDPDLVAETTVGLGTTSPEHKVQTLGFVLSEQKQALEKYGLDNPFTSMTQLYNTLEDLVEAGGLSNVGRYFKVVTPDIEAKMAEKLAKEAQQAAENVPVDPSKAMIQIENVKAQIKQLEAMASTRVEELKLQLEAMKTAEELDIKRDQLKLELAKAQQKSEDTQDSERIRALTRLAGSSQRNSQQAAPQGTSQSPAPRTGGRTTGDGRS